MLCSSGPAAERRPSPAPHRTHRRGHRHVECLRPSNSVGKDNLDKAHRSASDKKSQHRRSRWVPSELRPKYRIAETPHDRGLQAMQVVGAVLQPFDDDVRLDVYKLTSFNCPFPQHPLANFLVSLEDLTQAILYFYPILRNFESSLSSLLHEISPFLSLLLCGLCRA